MSVTAEGGNMKYFIEHEDKPGFMVAGVGIGSCCTVIPVTWTQSASCALLLEEGEAEATIDFIRDVVDWKLAEGLYIEQKEE